MQIDQGSTNRINQELRRAELEHRFLVNRRFRQIAQEPATDRVMISDEARALGRLHKSLMQQLSNLSDLREDQVALARERIAAGYYSREDIVDQIGEKLTNSAAAHSAVRGDSGVETPELAYRGELMSDVNEKIEAGFYSDDEVMAYVADRLLDIYGIK